ncbi:MAG: 16S rRNA (guanine(966)-N(2))-methyltransferase RsmD [Planctomyces sp.]
MRIIAGEFRRRQLVCAPGLVTRPMPDRVKESIFSMLGLRIEDANVVDLFAGSGAMGLEALSRGARSCLFVERDRIAAQYLKQNIDTLKCEARSTIAQGDALGLSIVARCPRPTDLIFMDPPYPLATDPAGWDRIRAQVSALGQTLADDGFVILRTPWPFVMTIPDDPASGEPAVDEKKPIKGSKKRHERRTGKVRWDEPERGGWRAKDRLARKKAEGDADEFADAEPIADEDDGAGFADMRLPADAQWLSPRELQRALDRAAAEDRAEDENAERLAESPDRESDIPPMPVPAAAKVPVLGDLAIAGMRGPETHPYGSTAVHFYQR